MGWPRKLILVRHAESEGNVRSVDERARFETATHAYGLTARGIEQAKITGKFIAEKFGYIIPVRYVSYYRRSRETMEYVYPGLNVYEDPRLAEAQRGIWHTMTAEQIDKLFPFERERKEREGLYHYRPFGGENWADVELRIHSFLGTLSRDYDDLDVIMVVHGHWLILFQRLIHHFSIEEAVERYRAGVFENASVTIYESEIIGHCSRLVLREDNIVPWKGLI